MSTLASLQDRSAEYERQGYLIEPHLLDAPLVTLLRNRIAGIAAGDIDYPPADIEYESAAQEQVRKINRCAENDPVFFECASHPAILQVVTALLGEDLKLFGSQCFMKPPGGVEKPYHQDSAYFTIDPPSLVTCWIALDEVTLDNGCLWVIPGSHQGDILDHSEPWEVAGRIDKQILSDLFDRNQETPILLPPGGASFHHSKLLHRSGANHTPHDRRGLAIHYMSARSRWTHPTQPKPTYPLLQGREHAGCV